MGVEVCPKYSVREHVQLPLVLKHIRMRFNIPMAVRSKWLIIWLSVTLQYISSDYTSFVFIYEVVIIWLELSE